MTPSDKLKNSISTLENSMQIERATHRKKNKNTHGNPGPCENVKIKSGEHIFNDGANLGQMPRKLVSVMRSGLRVRVSTEQSKCPIVF